MLDLPGIIEGAAHGEGRGREVIAVAKSADLVLIVLDAVREVEQHHKEILERELRTVGLRLNQTKPNITFKEVPFLLLHFFLGCYKSTILKKPTGGIVFAATCPITKLGDDPRRVVYQICKVKQNNFLC